MIHLIDHGEYLAIRARQQKQALDELRERIRGTPRSWELVDIMQSLIESARALAQRVTELEKP